MIALSIIYILIGMVLMGIIVWVMMPKMMLNTYKSKDSYEETINKLRSVIKSKENWKIPAEFDFQKNIHDANLSKIEKVGSIALCNPNYASMILSEEKNRKVSSIMPLTIGVYEDKSGQVYVSELNIGMMGKMFGGTIAKVMKVAGVDVKEIIVESIKK